MPSSMLAKFDEQFSRQIPLYLLDQSGFVCLVTKKKVKRKFSDYRDDTQAGLSDAFNALETQADFTESGTGLLVAKDQIITASHVVEQDPKKFNAYLGNSTYTVAATKPRGDYANVTVSSKSPPKLTDFSPVRIWDKPPPVGSIVWALGYPYCCVDLRFSAGKITGHGSGTVTTTLPAVVGCSGSPVFVQTQQGIMVLGIISFGPAKEVALFDGTVLAPTSTVSLPC